MPKSKKRAKARKKVKRASVKATKNTPLIIKTTGMIVNEQREKNKLGVEKGMHLDMHAIREGVAFGAGKEKEAAARIRNFEKEGEQKIKKGFFLFRLFAGKKIKEEKQLFAEWEEETAQDINSGIKKMRKDIGKELQKERKAIGKMQKKLAKQKLVKTLNAIEPKIISKRNIKGILQQKEKAKVSKSKQKSSLLDVFRRIFGLVKKISRPSVNEQPLLPEKSTITTIYDSIYAELKQNKIVEVKYLSKKYNMGVEQLISLARNFEETGKIEIIYPIFGSPKLALKEKGEFADETA